MCKVLLENWRNISRELGFEIEAPFELTLQNRSILRAPFLVKDFGARNGMIVVTDYAIIKPCRDEVVALGYGYSTLIESRDGSMWTKESCIKKLSDWSWTGNPDLKPDWIVPIEDY